MRQRHLAARLERHPARMAPALFRLAEQGDKKPCRQPSAGLAVSRLREVRAQKRGGDEIPLVLEELDECIPGKPDPQQAVEQKELQDAINRFLDGLDAAVRDVFIARYFYAASHSELSARTGWSVGKVKTVLRRTRLKLRTALKEEGLC